MLQPALTPEGILVTEGEARLATEKVLTSSLGAGEGSLLMLLVTQHLTTELDASWNWLREWGKRFMMRLCQTREVSAVAPPADEEVKEHLAVAPLFSGAEHLSSEVLQRWWAALHQQVVTQTSVHPGGLAEWMQEKAAAWRLVGRVTFHLAENKADSERPFAFLATFSEKLNATGQAQHLPLSRALQLYVGQKDETALNALLAPVREALGKSALIREWWETKRLFQASALQPGEAYGLLRESALLQECGIAVKFPNWWRSNGGTRPMVQVTIDAPKKAALHAGVLLSFKIDTALQGEPLTEEEWQKLLSAETGLVSLRGQWVEVQGERLRQAMEHWRRVQAAHAEGGVDFHHAMRLLAGLPANRSTDGNASAEMAAEWSQVIPGNALRDLLENLAAPKLMEPPVDLQATLRPYQQQGYSWLCFMSQLGLGACLADDMGLGKTLQVIALLLQRAQVRRAPALVVVPASLIGNWRTEVGRFAPSLRLLVAHPSALSGEEVEGIQENPTDALADYDVMLTTYGYLQRQATWQAHGWGMVILDEAQAIKNPSAEVTQAVKRLQAPVRIALTGTPIENRPGDLWSLFDFLNPGLLGSAGAFAETIKRLAKSAHGFMPLRRLIQPYLLRRMKTDRSIIQDLPEKIEVKAWCGLTKRQASVYAKLVDQLAGMLHNPNIEPNVRRGFVLGFLAKFKQICNHSSQWNGDGIWDEAGSGKFIRLGELCAEIRERRERVLVFTQFQETCDPLARFLGQVFGRSGLVLHGGTPVHKRSEMVSAFQQPGGPPFMVISVKAGGTGLNLTAASHVIHFDRWWNPAVENQATDRAFRIGQKKNVMVHKLICQGTLEERIDALLEEKTRLSKDLIGEASGEKLLSEMNAEELLHFVAMDASAVLG